MSGGPMINIITTHFKSQFHVTPGKYEFKTHQPSYTMERQRGGLNIEKEPIKMEMDSTEIRAEFGHKTMERFVADIAAEGKKAAFDAGTAYSLLGKSLLGANKSVIPQQAQQKRIDNVMVQTELGFIPTSSPKITWSNPSISISYEKDTLSFDWDVNRPPDVDFEKSQFTLEIQQYNRVDVEYLLGPHYVPKSASPGSNGTSIDVRG